MRNTAILFSVLLFFSCITGACSSQPDTAPKTNFANTSAAGISFWNTMPSNGLIFIGSAGMRSNRDESIEAAILDIARKIAIFNRVEGQFVSHNKTGFGLFNNSPDTQTSLNFNEDYQDFTENLEYDPDRDVIQIENTLFVRARFNSPGTITIPYRLPPRSGGRPGWIDNPPKELPGYLVGIGFAGRRSSHRDAVNASFEAAIFSIIKAVSSQVSAELVINHGNSLFDYAVIDENTISARGVLNGFYVLDTWIDTSTMSVWTLAIARIGEL
ncbi:hypothetical protein FACS189493_5850 [Spirochaetia bacterium]|nr:hypothetical protein FACS189493_5850 [Spirochaetia bacterium]